MRTEILKLPAIEFDQGGPHKLYSFALDAKQLPRMASVTRIRRDDRDEIAGYQRPEVVKHIRAIRDYIESEQPMIPNALVIAFDSRVTFKPSRASSNGFSRTGSLLVPLDEDHLPGFIVDGQQRSAAVRDSQVESFPMAATAFITDSEDEQRTQFILVNSTKPLPAGLIHELLPGTVGRLPSRLERRRWPAFILEQLNLDEDSVLHRRIKTATNPDGVIADRSMLRVIENSLTEGGLYRFRDPKTGEGDAKSMLDVLNNYWEAVSLAFPDAWHSTPRRSRLVHGAGIVAMGLVMDSIMDRRVDLEKPTVGDFRQDLMVIADRCCWTNGTWDFGPGAKRKWNELQNTSKDTQLLSNYLLSAYRELVWEQAS